MSNSDDVSRRRALAATTGIGSSILGIPAVVAGKSDDKQANRRGRGPREDGNGEGNGRGPVDGSEVSEEEVESALEELELLPALGAEDGEESDLESVAGRDLDPSDLPEDVEIYVGTYKNAEPPAKKPFAVETLEEYLERDAPPGFESDSVYAKDTPSTQSVDSLYLQENIGEVDLGPAGSVNVAFGAGLIFSFTGSSVSASVSVDLHIGGASFTIFTTSVGLGSRGDRWCIDRLSLDYGHIPGLTVQTCGSLILTARDGEIYFGGSISGELCADPCPWDCTYCQALGRASLSTTVPDPR